MAFKVMMCLMAMWITQFNNILEDNHIILQDSKENEHDSFEDYLEKWKIL